MENTTQRKPNILLIMTDQQRYDSLGCYGNKAVSTPNLDRLARDGTLFENCIVSNPICTPSRASLWTGKDLPQHGVMRLYDNLHHEEILFPEYLQKLGYRTGLFGKLHVSSILEEAERRHPHDGFDVYKWSPEACLCMDSEFHAYRKWLEKKDSDFCSLLTKQKRTLKNIPQELHFTHWAAEQTIEFIQPDNQTPWFACMSVFDPHNPYDCGPREFINQIEYEKILRPIKSELYQRPAEHEQESRDNYFGDFKNFSPDDIIEMRCGYYSMLNLLDAEIGRVLDCLEETGQLENTLIIFTSDHGDMLGDHQLLVKGAYFFDPCVKVPLILHWPDKIKKGCRISSIIQNYDLTATILLAAGMPAETCTQELPQSRNLMNLADNHTESVREYAICRYRNTGIRNGDTYWTPEIHGTMIREENWKLSVYHNSGNGELYDLLHDPEEQKNLWNNPRYKEEQTRLKQLLDQNISKEEFSRPPRGGETLPVHSRGQQ